MSLVWAQERTQIMKGKRHATEDKIRILREVERAALKRVIQLKPAEAET